MALSTKGILNPHLAAQKFNLSRHSPSEDLAFFVERYWLIDWDLRGEAPYISENLPYPCVNLVFEEGRSGVFGVNSAKYSHLLEGKGQVFGVKFRVGAFYPFVNFPIARLKDNCMSLEVAFGVDANRLTKSVFSQISRQAQIKIVENFLREHLPEEDKTIVLLNAIVEKIAGEATIRKVEALTNYFSISKRHLQRLFNQYVGISPKWVIMRYRLQEAAEEAEKSLVNWSKLAVDLGYFDQAHFIKDFKRMIGKTPTEYARTAQIKLLDKGPELLQYPD